MRNTTTNKRHFKAVPRWLTDLPSFYYDFEDCYATDEHFDIDRESDLHLDYDLDYEETMDKRMKFAGFYEEHLKYKHDIYLMKFSQYLMNDEGKRVLELQLVNEWPHFWELEESDLLEYAKDGGLVFGIELELTRIPRRAECISSQAVIPPGSLIDDLGSLLDTGFKSDCIVETNGESIETHQIVLAMRSPVFKAMFENDMKESRERTLKIESTSPSAVKLLLRYIYTDKLEFSDEEQYGQASELFKLAHLYQINRLVTMCENILINLITAETLSEILKLTETYETENLRNKALEFIKINKETLPKKMNLVELLSYSDKLGEDILVALSQ